MDLENIFKYHTPSGDDPAHYEAIRAGAKAFAEIVIDHTPKCADQTAAIRKIREATMTANASIALKGAV